MTVKLDDEAFDAFNKRMQKRREDEKNEKRQVMVAYLVSKGYTEAQAKNIVAEEEKLSDLEGIEVKEDLSE